MADGTDVLVHALTRLLAELIREATRLSIEMAERRAERLRRAAQESEKAARAERARLAGHRAADAAIWRRTADPVWWRKATPEQLARAWRAASTWHHVDPEAAGARRVIADRLRRRGIDVDTDRTANPGDVRWLQTALDLAMAEREEQAAYAAERDSDHAVLADELLWNSDEQPRVSADVHDEERTDNETTGTPAAAQADNGGNDPVQIKLNTVIIDGTAVTYGGDEFDALEWFKAGNIDYEEAHAILTEEGDHAALARLAAMNDSAAPQLQARAPGRSATAEGSAASAVATEPNTPRRHSDVDLDRMESMLRRAWPADKAEHVLEDASWPGLASTMQRLDRAGKDVPKLLRDLPIDTTTDVQIPAMLTAWTLRAAANGPSALGRAVRQRERHLHRTAAARRTAEQWHTDLAHDDQDTVVRPAGDVDPSVARLLTAAFPTTTKQSLNRMTIAADAGGSPETAHDRTASRDPVGADLEQ